MSLSSIIIYYNNIVTENFPGISGFWKSGSWNLRFLEVGFLEPQVSGSQVPGTSSICILSACIDKDSQFVHNVDEISNILGETNHHFVV